MNFNKHKAKFAVAALGVTGALLLSACQANTAAQSDDATLQWAIAGNNLDAGHMDPHASQLDSSAMLGRLVLDSLTYLDEDGKLQPWLAKSWEVSADGLKVTFKLRDDVTFTDGEKFNAAAVKANFEHIMAEETESASADDMLGGDAFKGVSVIDEYTAEVEFNRPFAPFLTFSANSQLGFYSPKALAANADKLASGDPAANIGTGPWKLTEVTAGSGFKYERNDDYNWYPEGIEVGNNNVAKLEVAIVSEDALRVSRVESNEAQVASELSPVAVENTELEVTAESAPGIPYSLYLNTKSGPTSDAAVREALSLAADREAIVDAVFGGFFDAAGAVLSPTTSYTTLGDTDPVYDPDKAAAVLDAAGWVLPAGETVREKDGQKLSLRYISWTPRGDDKQAVTDLLVDQWRSIGIEVVNEVIEPGDYNERYGAGEFELTDWAYSAVDPDILRNHLHSEGFQNASFVNDPAIDAKLEAAAASSDAAERTKLYDELVAWVAASNVIVPIYTGAPISVNNDHVSGLEFDANGWPVFFSVSVN